MIGSEGTAESLAVRASKEKGIAASILFVALVAGQAGGRGKKDGAAVIVLFVDDDQEILESIQIIFEALLPNVRLLCAGSGDAALRLMETEKVDLLITDYRMPTMNGIELCNLARGKVPGLPTLLVSAFGSDQLQEDARAAGFSGFLPKPFDHEALIESVKSFVHVD